jgi:hypothetical protein
MIDAHATPLPGYVRAACSRRTTIGLYPMALPQLRRYPSSTADRQPDPAESIMKSTIISFISLISLGLLASCTFVERTGPSTRTTTSEITPTVYGTMETKTTRTY